MSAMQNAPSLADFDRLAADAFAKLPDEVQTACSGIVIRVEDWPSTDQIADLGETDALSVTGLYDGVPLTEKSVLDAEPRTDFVWLFRRPIIDEWAERGNVTLSEMISHVLVHELAHHLGWSDDDIAEVDRWWE